MNSIHIKVIGEYGGYLEIDNCKEFVDKGFDTALCINYNDSEYLEFVVNRNELIEYLRKLDNGN